MYTSTPMIKHLNILCFENRMEMSLRTVGSIEGPTFLESRHQQVGPSVQGPTKGVRFAPPRPISELAQYLW